MASDDPYHADCICHSVNNLRKKSSVPPWIPLWEIECAVILDFSELDGDAPIPEKLSKSHAPKKKNGSPFGIDPEELFNDGRAYCLGKHLLSK